MSKIYVEQWEVWSTAQYKLLAYDTDNLRKTFPNLQKMSDEEIKQYDALSKIMRTKEASCNC